MNWTSLGIIIYIILSIGSIIAIITYYLRHPNSIIRTSKESSKTQQILFIILIGLAYSMVALVAINIIQGIFFAIWLIIKITILKIS
jgi:hypothetical protein